MATARYINTNSQPIIVDHTGGPTKLPAGGVTPAIDTTSAEAVALLATSGVRAATTPEATAWDAGAATRGQYDPDFTPSGGLAPDWELPTRDGIETAVQQGLGPDEGFLHGPLFGLEKLDNAELASRAAQAGVAPATINGASRSALLTAIAAIEGAQPNPEYPV